MVQKTEPEMEAIWILRENTPFSRKRELDLLLETAKPKVASSILSTMYKQINSVRRIDFVEIDKSKGDFKKLSFVKTIDDALGYLEKEADATETKIIRTAEANLISMKKQFMDAYKIGSDLAVLTYQTMVMAILDSVSTLITKTATSVVKTKEKCAKISLEVLKKFNASVKSGKMRNSLNRINENYLLKNYRDLRVVQEVATETVALIAGVMLAIAIVPLLRELIFYFYYARMKISDYLDQLVMYIKINEIEVKNNSKFTDAKKKDVLKKQEAWIARLDQISDKIRVNQSLGEKTAKEQVKKGNSEITLDEVKDDIAEAPPSTDGFDF